MTAHALKELDVKEEYTQDNIKPSESAEEKRKRIAQQSEAACRDSLDFEAFLAKYSKGSESDFA